jgi:uroporphyrinogen-III synthase
MRVLVTRPRDDAETTAAKLTALGHAPVIAPLMEIRFHDGGMIALDGEQAILATSANGVRAIARRSARRDIPLFAVGRQTAQAAREAGYLAVRSADGDGPALARATLQWAKPEDGALVHAAGAQTKGDLAATLSAQGFSVRTEILYEAVPAGAFPAEAEQALRTGALDAVLLYSPRGARTFATLAAGLSCRTVMAACISQATADALAGLDFRDVAVARKPDQDALLALLTRPL